MNKINEADILPLVLSILGAKRFLSKLKYMISSFLKNEIS